MANRRIWTDQAVDFLENSANYTKSYQTLAKAINSFIPPNSNLCDCGAGTGHLGLELSALGHQVVLADISKKVLAHRVINDKTHIFIEDLFKYPIQPSCQILLFCMFGNCKEILEIAKRNQAKQVIVIRRIPKSSRFSLAKTQKTWEAPSDFADFLNSLGILYKTQTITLDMGQPLKSQQEAMDFYQLFNRDNTVFPVNFCDISHKLQEIDNPKYQYYWPAIRDYQIFSFFLE